MRMPEKNMSTLWCVNVESIQDAIDLNGYFTGEKIKVYGSPFKIRIAVYPADGQVTEMLFGRDSKFDLTAVSDRALLNVDSLLFMNEPISTEYIKTYDYAVSKVNTSLNFTSYGLKKRV